MTRNIKVEPLRQTPIEKQEIELVERKGIGHPDSIADGLAEAVSQALCAEYIDRCGAVLHHNTDETQIVAGRSYPAFGGGEVISPIYILLVGRATKEFDGIHIPTDTTALQAARDYLRENILNLNVERDIILDCKLGEGSSDLRDVFHRTIPGANDTSFGVGFAPLSETEQITYHAEQELMNLRKKIPAIGEDTKIMGLREKDKITLVVACAMVGRHLNDLEHYISVTADLRDRIRDMAAKYTDRDIEVLINAADDLKNESLFLTVTGTSAEMGDDGSVGRGNRCNGLITPYRPMSMEATSGKNPVNHVGKIYNLLANKIASEVAETVDGVEEIHIRMLSEIGKPIDQPLVADAGIVSAEGADMDALQQEIKAIIDRSLADITDITRLVAEGKLATF
ncbi:MAG: S-adenosylmethionine synthetase [Candidatus Methanogaster sp.]|uniref:S-adenosylmethionine synthetase n=1 Tax=Candidatus Methanogaster sp. TaxID=3386292 RepID=A0AC61KZ13_9EURY|nr:MAG: S-adenosylmethionine synthetase [ANME-2 cluster archaeon]